MCLLVSRVTDVLVNVNHEQVPGPLPKLGRIWGQWPQLAPLLSLVPLTPNLRNLDSPVLENELLSQLKMASFTFCTLKLRGEGRARTFLRSILSFFEVDLKLPVEVMHGFPRSVFPCSRPCMQENSTYVEEALNNQQGDGRGCRSLLSPGEGTFSERAPHSAQL